MQDEKFIGFTLHASMSHEYDEIYKDRRFDSRIDHKETAIQNSDEIGCSIGDMISTLSFCRELFVLARALVWLSETENLLPVDLECERELLSAAEKVVDHWEKHDEGFVKSLDN